MMFLSAILALAIASTLPFDRFGGWAEGPPLELPLETCERIEGNEYHSDVRWTKRVWGGEKHALVRKHSLGKGRRFSEGKILVRKDRWTTGRAYLEVSGDDGVWHRVGEMVKGEMFEGMLPSAAFPCDTLSVRFVGDDGASYEQNGYNLTLKFNGAQLWQVNSTNAFYTATSGAWLSPYAWTVDSLRNVPRFGAKPPRSVTTNSLNLALAANEAESVQFIVSPQADMREVKVEVDVPGLEAEALMVDWREVTNPTDSSGVTGYWPDPLRGQSPHGVDIPRGSNRAFWIRVFAPPGSKKGVYAGEIRLRERGDDGKTQRCPIRVEVFGFALPEKKTCLTSFGFDEWKLKKAGCDVKAFQHQLDRHFMTRFGKCRPYKYVYDEPDTNDYEKVRKLCADWKSEHPDIPRMVTEQPCPELVGSVDIWCPRTDFFKREDVASVQARGEEYWWYICCGPKAPYAGLFIDRPGCELRTWLWQTWAERVTGVLIWHTHWWSESRDDNGDGTFFYKDDSGLPVETIRAEAFRDGVEDYEYLAILSRLKGVRARVPEEVTRSLTEFDRTGKSLLKARCEIAREIETLRGGMK